ncbi:hypothetical protein [Nostoc sp. CALU 546]|uniref:hypothetical protein n=1 Tax=Nostoc sp. CALU 546 TaxID=1867241 RepID=UPI003B675327
MKKLKLGYALRENINGFHPHEGKLMKKWWSSCRLCLLSKGFHPREGKLMKKPSILKVIHLLYCFHPREGKLMKKQFNWE